MPIWRFIVPKEAGRGTFCLYDEAMDRRVKKRRALEEDLRFAIEREEFHLVYQPQISIPDGEITGVEALLRWNHPTRGLVSPGDFIPIAELTGAIIPMSEWVLSSVCAQNRAWQDAGLPEFSASVNVSPRHFKQENWSSQ